MQQHSSTCTCSIITTILNAVVVTANYRHASLRHCASGKFKNESTLCHQEVSTGKKWTCNGLNCCCLWGLKSHLTGLGGCNSFAGLLLENMSVCLHLCYSNVTKEI